MNRILVVISLLYPVTLWAQNPVSIAQVGQTPVTTTVPVSGSVSAAATLADGADVTQGAKADAKSTATDTTPITLMQVFKEISFMEQNPASRAVTNAGTFAVQAAQSGTWNIGTVTTLTGITNALPAGSNVIGHVIADTGSTTAVTGNVTVTQATGTNLHAVIDTGSTTAVTQATAANLNATVTGVVTGSGTSTSAMRVELPTNGTGLVTTNPATAANWAIYVEDAAETAAGNLMMAGSVRRDVAASSAGTTGDNATINTDALGLAWTRTLDPCGGILPTPVPFSISSATTTQLIAASASNKNYICAINLVVSAADNVALVEDDTSACASPTAGMAGGTTAATGWNFAANGGLFGGNGGASVFITAATNRYTCLITSSTAQLSGSITYVQAP